MLWMVDDKIIVVLNGKIIVNNIINISCELNCCIDMVIGVFYDVDIDVVKKVLGDIIVVDLCIMYDKGVIVCLNEMVVFFFNFMVCVWIINGDVMEVYWDLMENFKCVLDVYKIGILYLQMDVYLYQVDKVEFVLIVQLLIVSE